MSGKRPRSSPAWNYFYEIDKSTMVCCMCNDHIRIGNGSTSNLLIHLRVKHKDVKINDNDTGIEYVQPNTRRQAKKIKPIQKMKIGKNTYQVPLIAAVNDHEYQNQHQLASQCYSYAGGHVYPQEAGGSKGHTLHWSKAQISKPAPDFEGTAVVNGEFKELKLSQFKGKYLVFFFYPLDFTFVCPTEIIAFSDRINEFRAINTEVVACSVDSSFTHLAWIKTPRKEGGLGPLNIPLLSDLTHQISKDYGVYLEDLGHTLRGLFIIDSKGILRQMTLNDLPVGRSVDETLRLVQAFQYTDQHGEVCPAGWKPGGETIIPNPEEKLKYFSKFNDNETR